MASSDMPSQMEEKHFGFGRNENNVKANKKNATKDFLNTEAGKHNVAPGSTVPTATEQSINIDQSSNGELDTVVGSGQSKTKSAGTPENESLVIFNGDEEEGANSDTGNLEDEDVDQNIDNDLPNTVTVLKTPEGGKCYVVGTAHFSLESQNDVSKVIQAVKPHIVVVELCLDRIHVLQLDEETILREAKNLNFNKIMDTIKQNGLYKGLFYILLLNMSARLTKILGLAPGGEFRRALKEAKQIPNCLVQLGDRPIKITFGRALRLLSWWQTMKLAWRLIREREPITKEDVEKYKSRDSLEEMMADLAGQYPALKEVFVNERDIYLTHALQLACKPRINVNGKLVPARVVGVVGMGHTIGIIEHWGKVKRHQIPPIMSIPPPSLSSKILKFTIRASFVGAIIYVGYRLIPVPYGIAQSFKSSVEGLLKVSASQ